MLLNSYLQYIYKIIHRHPKIRQNIANIPKIKINAFQSAINQFFMLLEKNCVSARMQKYQLVRQSNGVIVHRKFKQGQQIQLIQIMLCHGYDIITQQSIKYLQFIAGILVLFYKIMNTNLEHSNTLQRPEYFFACQPSPYLSPLFGSASSIHQNSQDELNDFKLEEEPQYMIGGEPNSNQHDASLNEILLIGESLIPNPVSPLELDISSKKQIQTPFFFPSSNKSQVYEIISFLSSNDHLKQAELLSFGKPLYENSKQLQFIFRTLLLKFLKLRKTKEEMVKYCMRKAFKFIGDTKKQKNGKGKKQKNDKKNDTDMLIVMPFRKNSSEKTMNSQYLKQVFSNQQFIGYYRQFLNSIEQIIEDDNNSKIVYLSDTIQKLLQTNNIGEVEKIKRLPWNRTILKKTEDLARTLIQFANQSSDLSLIENEGHKNQQQHQQSN